MKAPLSVFVILAIAFWASAICMFLIGSRPAGPTVLRWAALSEAVIALVFSAVAFRKWLDR